MFYCNIIIFLSVNQSEVAYEGTLPFVPRVCRELSIKGYQVA